VPTFASSTERPTDVAVDVLVLPVFEGSEPGPGVSDVRGLDLIALYRASGATGKRGEFLLVPNTGVKGLAATAVLLLGVGKRAEADADACRRAIGRVAGHLAKRKSVATSLPQVADDIAGASQATVEGMLLGSYRFERYKSKADGASGKLAKVTLLSG
jgi:leucyl aminopeptidase